MVTVAGIVQDNGTIKKVEASFDNLTWVVCTGQGAWTCVMNLTAGSNKVTVRATDGGNNHGYDDVTLHLDVEAPSVTISGLTNGTKVKKKEQTISGTATDNIGIEKVEVIVNGQTITATGTVTWTADVTLQKGDNTITVRVTDSAGNVEEETMTIKYKKEEKQQPGFEAVVFLGAMAMALVVMTTLRRRK
jgi:chitinase